MTNASQYNKEALTKQLWLLFSDTNTRLNILIEECAHLQNTIFGLFDSDLEVEIIELFRSEPTEELCCIPTSTIQYLASSGFARPVLIEFKSHPKYAGSSPRNRALLNTWNTLGALIVGLTLNQRTLRARFTDTTLTLLQDNYVGARKGIGAPFWFMAMRGYLTDQAFSTYTQILEHAHEKIIQIQENRAGVLPAPILLRRWNSALLGDFLSRYARHVDWESYIFIGRLIGITDNELSKKRNKSSITHTWAHTSTSYTTSFSISADIKGKMGRRWSFGSIRSAYFYLEQPVLFPLLYHECAHLHFPNEAELRSNKTCFFRSRQHACSTLSLPGITEGIYDNFWDHFTEEIWSDCIAIALSGRAYLAAIVLQVFASSWSKFFSHHDGIVDEVFPLDTLGDDDKRLFQANYPDESDTDFWEARLLIATKLCRALHDGDATTVSFCKEIEELISYWFDAGKVVFNAHQTSNEHRRLWDYKIDLTHWIKNTIWMYIEPHKDTLKHSKQISSMNEISATCAKKIDETVKGFINRYILSDYNNHNKTHEVPTRIENVALDARLTVSHCISRSIFRPARSILSKANTDLLGEKLVDKICNNFSNWMRHDGSMAFRIALEWYMSRISYLEQEAINNNNETITRQLKTKSVFNTDSKGSRSIEIQNILTRANQISDFIIESICPTNGQELSVGILSLGTLRPIEISRTKSTDRKTSPYKESINKLKIYYRDAQSKANGIRFFQRNEPASFLPLIGEYQYLYFNPKNTPTEREFYPQQIFQTLNKPRLVIQVLGNGIEVQKDLPVGRVALIRFKHRYQWHKLLEKLKKQGYKKNLVTMFVSSAWEDAILITWHSNDESMWKFYNGNGPVFRALDIDIQSSAICPHLEDSDAHPNSSPIVGNYVGFPQALLSSLNGTNSKFSLHNRIGRHDYTIYWSSPQSTELQPPSNNTGSVVKLCADALMRLHSEVWARIDSITHALEEDLEHTFEDQRKRDRRTPYRAISMVSTDSMNRSRSENQSNGVPNKSVLNNQPAPSPTRAEGP